MKKYLGLERYDDFEFENIILGAFDGLIIGDPFCEKRMFPYGEAQMTQFFMECKNRDIKIIYQSPMYLTDAVLSKETDRVAFLYEKMNVRCFLVQDIGLVTWIHEKYPKAEMIWSRYGRTRNSMLNGDFLLYLKEIGIRSYETNKLSRVRAISSLGLRPYAVFGWPSYQTINRECYSLYMENIYNCMCLRQCWREEVCLKHGAQKISIDGYMLGLKLTYENNPEFLQEIRNYGVDVMCWFADIRDAEGRLKNYENIGRDTRL